MSGNPGSGDWTDDELKIAHDGWMAGDAASVISRRLPGRTRNSVIGIVNRRKWVRTIAPKPVRRSSQTPKTPQSQRSRATVIRVRKPIERDAEPDIDHASVFELIEKNRPPLVGVPPISILDLPNRHGVRCRFPVDGGYCGAPSGDHTYCETHAAIAYTSPPPRKGYVQKDGIPGYKPSVR